MSRSDDASSPTGSANKKPHAPLTAEQKKQNHILSEQKRRGNIRQSFDRLTTIVPGTEGRGRSEMIVLSKTDEHIKEELLRRKELVEKLEARGFVVSEADKLPLKQLNNFVDPTGGDWTLKPGLVGLDLESTPKKGGGKGSRGESETTDEGGMS